jgi:hypothetical protein
MVDGWMPREKWQAMVRSENCPLYREIAAKDTVSQYG